MTMTGTNTNPSGLHQDLLRTKVLLEKAGHGTVRGQMSADEINNLVGALLKNRYGKGVISFAKDGYNPGRENVYNMQTGKQIAESVDLVLLSEENSGELPTAIRKTRRDFYDAKDKYIDIQSDRYYIDAVGNKVSKDYTTTIDGFSKAGIAVISDEANPKKRQFIDSRFNVRDIDGITSFDFISKSRENPCIYLAEVDGKRFILNKDLNKVFDTTFSKKDKIDVIYTSLTEGAEKDNFIVIEKDGKPAEFYNSNGVRVDDNQAGREKLVLTRRDKRTPDTTDFIRR